MKGVLDPRRLPQPPLTGRRLAPLAEVAPEVGDGEGDPAALTGVDEALLQQRVTGRGEGLGLLAERRSHVGAGDGVLVAGRTGAGAGASDVGRFSNEYIPDRFGLRALNVASPGAAISPSFVSSPTRRMFIVLQTLFDVRGENRLV